MSRPTPLDETGLLNFLIFAEPGWGKTRLAGSTAELGDVLLLRAPTDHTEAILSEHRKRIKQLVLRDWDDLWDSMEYVRHEGANFFMTWLDNVSLIQDHGLDDIWDTVITEKPQRKRYGLDKQEYGINMFRLGQYLRHIVGGEVANFGMTAHTAWLPSTSDEEAEGDIEEKLMPQVQGKNMSPKFCGYMNMVAYGNTDKKGTRRLYFNNTPLHYGKDAFDAFLPDHKLVKPTMKKIVTACEKTGKLKTAPTPKGKGRRKKRPKRGK